MTEWCIIDQVEFTIVVRYLSEWNLISIRLVIRLAQRWSMDLGSTGAESYLQEVN